MTSICHGPRITPSFKGFWAFTKNVRRSHLLRRGQLQIFFSLGAVGYDVIALNYTISGKLPTDCVRVSMLSPFIQQPANVSLLHRHAKFPTLSHSVPLLTYASSDAAPSSSPIHPRTTALPRSQQTTIYSPCAPQLRKPSSKPANISTQL